MNDLTEQWKNGELENNWYYVRTTNGIEKWEYIKQSHGFGYYETEWVLEILAKVPSYDEWKVKLEENTKLKELLKECKQWFDWYHIDTGTGKEYIESWHKKGHEIHQKINQALGEDK